MGLDDRGSIGSRPPWADSASGRHETGPVSLRYRGWALVDDRGYRWAAEDGTNRRIKVCREHGLQQADALRAFRRIVDREVGNGIR